MKIFKSLILIFLLSFYPSTSLLADHMPSMAQSVVIVASSLVVLVLTGFLMNFNESEDRKSDLEPVLCYYGEWGKMFCEVIKTAQGNTRFICSLP